MAKFDLKGMLSERSAQEIDLPEQKTVYRNPEDLIPSKDNFYSTEAKTVDQSTGNPSATPDRRKRRKRLSPGWTPEKKVLSGVDRGRV